MPKAKVRMGRPPGDPEERREKRIPVLATLAQFEELRVGAKADKQTVSTWLLELGLERARQLAVGPGTVKKARRSRG